MRLDFWLPNGPIVTQLQLFEVEILQLDAYASVDSLISNLQWVIPETIQLPAYFQLQVFLSQLYRIAPPSTSHDTVDWLPSPTLKFSLAHTMNYLTPPSIIFPWHYLLWFKYHIPKHGIITWLAVRNRCYTLDSKPMLNKHNTNARFLCNSDYESLDHLFFSCNYSSHIWRVIQEVTRFTFQPHSWSDLIAWCSTHWISQKFLVHKLLLSAAVYFLWMERNSRAFRNKSSSPQHVMSQIKSSVRARLASVTLRYSSDLSQVVSYNDLQILCFKGCSITAGHSWLMP
ncbi:uncharacterized protein LOC132300982 [Cornus florida]|uniref:uncharacterized protein LOC132300982 n=1 Tax=Cornus florida TaxID=4283 RepID=UPI0028A24B96|nr:uncharacterized protein LOC132300982 [Cornus florida]